MPWMKRRKEVEEEPEVKMTPGERKAEECLGEALVQMMDAEEKVDAVQRLTKSLQRIRERNHFSEALEQLFGEAK